MTYVTHLHNGLYYVRIRIIHELETESSLEIPYSKYK